MAAMELLIAEKYRDYELEGGLPISAFDIDSGTGVDIIDACNSNITTEAIVAKDGAAELDWIIDCSGLFSCHVTVGNLIVVELKTELISAVKAIKDNCFLWTKQGWGWLVDRSPFTIEVDGVLRVCWIGERCSLEDVSLKNYLTDAGQRNLADVDGCTSTSVKAIKARSVSAMEFLDGVHRDYVYKHDFVAGDVLAVTSVAGSGKTTMLLKLATIHKTKRVLYLAFNKSLQTEIAGKIKSGNIKNMNAMTFDSLMWHLFHKFKPSGVDSDIKLVDLKPHNIGQYIPWLLKMPFKLKHSYCKNFSKFCMDTEYTDIELWCLKVLKKKDNILEKLWLAAKEFRLVSFEIIRKLAFIGKWFKGYIDTIYDLILCDETQDFDMNMLRMLLDDTTAPKVFVGDPKQSIYEFRGCINAFNHMPREAIVIEFYSTFRIGEPACSLIRGRVPDLWMISKAPGGRQTQIGGIMTGWKKAVWLFRSWRFLFQAARITGGIWIYGFDTKLAQIRSLHAKLSSSWSVSDDDEFEDDLPKFLKSITKEELEALISDIERNLVMAADAKWNMYTVHSYKGMENTFVRMSSDIIIDEVNLYYVAITRGFQQTVLDVGEADSGSCSSSGLLTDSNGCNGDGKCIKQCLHKPHLSSQYGAVGYCPSSCVHKCVPQKCLFWSSCKQKRPKYILDGSKGQCFECRIGL